MEAEKEHLITIIRAMVEALDPACDPVFKARALLQAHAIIDAIRRVEPDHDQATL